MRVNWFGVLMYVGCFGSAWLADTTGRWQWIFGALGTELVAVAWIILKVRGA